MIIPKDDNHEHDDQNITIEIDSLSANEFEVYTGLQVVCMFNLYIDSVLSKSKKIFLTIKIETSPPPK